MIQTVFAFLLMSSSLNPGSSIPKDTANLQNLDTNKVIPVELREEILTALSYYPELKDTYIEFVFSETIRTSIMQAQPRARTLLWKKKRREYVIRISRYFHLSKTHVKIESLPKEVLIGWIGHELGHIMDYTGRGRMGMARFGAGYVLSKRYIRKAERAADTFAVSRGLLPYILATKNFILDHADLPESYKRKIRKLYLSPDDVMTLAESFN